MKRILSFILAGMMMVLLASCGGGGSSSSGSSGSGSSSGGTITINLGGGTPLSIDPALNSASAGSNVLKLANAGMMGWQWEGGKAVLKPELAESYTISDDKLTYTFTLREGLKWSDGSDFTASDIAFAWNRAVDPELGAEYQYMFDVIDGYDEENPHLNISADDAARTFTAVLAAPTPYFLELCAFPTYYPVKESVVDPEGTWATNPASYIGMGAFRMTKYAVDDMISFEKNPNYWNASNVILDGVNCILSEDNSANLTSFETGATLFITQPDPGEYDRLKSTYGNQLVFGDYIGTYFIQFNVYKDVSPVGGPVLSANDQAKARSALANLINRVELVETVTRGGQAPAQGYVPHMSDGFNDDFRKVAPGYFQGTNTPSAANAKYTEDQVLGIEALIDLGYQYKGSIAGGDFSLTNFPAIEYSLNFAGANKLIIEYVQEIWGGYGVTVTVNGEAWATLQQKVRDGGFDASRMGWIADYNDAINFLDMFVGISGNNHTRLGKNSGIFTGDTTVTGDFGLGAYWGRNHNQTWADAYESLIREIKIDASLTLEQRAVKLQEAEWILLDAGCVCPIYYYTNPYMLSNRVHDVIILNTGDVIWTYASFTA